MPYKPRYPVTSLDQIIPTCKNCRHKGTRICIDWKRMKKNQPNTNTQHCKFWAYNPNGNKIWKTQL